MHDHHHHDHDHDHPHATLPDVDDRPATYHQRLEVAVRELLVGRGIISADDIRRTLELGIRTDGTKLVVVENTPRVHNLIVCTLCSCYPRAVLGFPPDWYKSSAYRSRAVREPRSVLAEFGTVIADDVEVHVHDSTADMRYLVLPMRPAGSDEMSDAELAGLVTRDSMIGVSQPRVPQK
jgi:nitrile hydratase